MELKNDLIIYKSHNDDIISYTTHISTYKNDIININDKTFHLYETNIKDNNVLYSFNKIKNYVMNEIITKHNYFYNVNDSIANITNMNELYVSVIGGGGSDNVFETPHIDGPFFFLPFCKVYRCIFGITSNKTIKTIFLTNIMSTSYILDKNQFLAFDYNRDIHYINKITETPHCKNTEDRIVLKLHYITYPPFLPNFIIQTYKMLHSYYNSGMRFLFLNSQSKNNQWLSNIINTMTIFYSKFFI